ncbi:uncharacterized protein BT62DRAFT_929058, partial [Guyanagaster necrorhizus]
MEVRCCSMKNTCAWSSWIDAINNSELDVNQIHEPGRQYIWESTYIFLYRNPVSQQRNSVLRERKIRAPER